METLHYFKHYDANLLLRAFNFRKENIIKQKIIIAIACLAGLIGGIICWIAITSQDSSNPETTIQDLSAIRIDYMNISFDNAIANAQKLPSSDGTVTIDTAGSYILSGDYSGGIVIDTAGSAVYLILDNATISNRTGAAIYAKKSDTVFIGATEGSKNTISDPTSYSEDYGDEDVDAAIYAKDNLAFIGNGSISIVGNSNHAIHGKDYIQILSGNLKIESANDGIVGKDYVAMQNGSISIQSSSDGIKTTNEEDGFGQIIIDGGSLSIESTGDAINAITTASITSGNFTITSGGGAKTTSASSKWGKWSSQNSKTTNTSAKGIKAQKNIIITGGTFNLSTSDDAIHSNGSIQIDNGNFTIKTGDDAVHADTSIKVNNGNINIAQSHEGIESSYIIIANGDISIIDDDDGLNASGGNDSSSINGRAGQNKFSSSTGKLTISGGKLYINSEGDGLDANGSIEMTGGTVHIDGPTNDGNGAIDYDGSFNISGGTLIAAGTSGMLQSASSTSTQNTVAITFSSTQAANSNFKFTDTNGKAIIDYTPSKQYTSIVFSSPDITSGSKYTASVDDNTEISIEITDILTSYGTNNRSNGSAPNSRR